MCQASKLSRRPITDGTHVRKGSCVHVELEADGSDAWRLEQVAKMLREGAVGIIPTDSYPAFVCDLGNAAATAALANIKEVSPKKPMSILCRNFRDVDTYTMGWPVSTIPGLPDAFRLVKDILPGCYTIILPASKNMPKVITTNPSKQRTKQRHTVGVRLPDCHVCQELLKLCDRPLLCTSVHVEEDSTFEVADAATMMDRYPGIDFIVDTGPIVAEPSTVVDMTGASPEVLRVGKGDPSPFDPYNIL